ncbi:formyltransferase family protein [Rummeliibacillus stabekisii]|uniref:Formyl transferase N-terminal domain-containing protein n=1 Tax=Rummeliibacillus stabekisii TaxID=241244 RepID=A0A143HDF2_9BACL|nr:formyltransferase family protein [Rummeliibacillus stabekisii]AMW99777.1 hypothetical protein ATY39_10200 [Rummeliibacillus stabekisii]
MAVIFTEIVLFSNGRFGDLVFKLVNNIQDVEIVLHVTENSEKDKKHNNIYLFDINKDNNLDFLELYKFDLILMFSWRHRISMSILNKYKIFNLHPSLLPKYRGAYPIIFQMLNEEEVSGMTLYKLDEHYDTGPIYGQEKFKMASSDKSHETTAKMLKATKRLLNRFFEDFSKNADVKTIPQSDKGCSYYGVRNLNDYKITQYISLKELKRRINIFGSRIPLKFLINGKEVCVNSYSMSKDFNHNIEFKLQDCIIYLEKRDKG